MGFKCVRRAIILGEQFSPEVPFGGSVPEGPFRRLLGTKRCEDECGGGGGGSVSQLMQPAAMARARREVAFEVFFVDTSTVRGVKIFLPDVLLRVFWDNGLICPLDVPMTFLAFLALGTLNDSRCDCSLTACRIVSSSSLSATAKSV